MRLWGTLPAGLVCVGVLAACGLLAPPTPTATPAPPTLTPTPTETPLPPTATLTPIPVPAGELIERCGNDLCIVTVAGGSTPLGLSSNFTIQYGPDYGWSVDGRQILFGGWRFNEPSLGNERLFIVNRDGSNPREFFGVYNQVYALPRVSPDGQWIAIQHNCNIGLLPAGSSRPHDFVYGGGGGPNAGSIEEPPTTCPNNMAWSPDGQRIAYLWGRPGFPESVWVTDLSGRDRYPIYRDPLRILSPNHIGWSPDGQTVAILLNDGTPLLIPADCNVNAGCDPSVYVPTGAFPLHWLPTFWPPWGGETP